MIKLGQSLSWIERGMREIPNYIWGFVQATTSATPSASCVTILGPIWAQFFQSASANEQNSLQYDNSSFLYHGLQIESLKEIQPEHIQYIYERKGYMNIWMGQIFDD